MRALTRVTVGGGGGGGDSWVTLDLSAPDWNEGAIIDGGSSTLGESSIIITNATEGNIDAGRDGHMLGFQVGASYGWLSSAVGVAFEVTADQPTGDGVVGIGAFVCDTQLQASAAGFANGIEWNSGRTVCRATAGMIGAGNTDGSTLGAPSSITAYIFIPFASDRAAPNGLVTMDNAGTVSDSAAGAALVSAATNFEVGLWLNNGNATACTWANVVIKYKLVSVS